MAQPPLFPETQVFDRVFMLNGSNVDPRDVPYEKILHLEISTSNNRISTKNWYINFNDQSGQFAGLSVRNTYTYTVNGSNVLIKSVEFTEWFFEDGTAGVTRTLTTIYR
jgi:hypothetical protein